MARGEVREEDDAVALMRVYCGLAASEPVGPQAASEWLTAAVVDDAGRLLDICDIGDDAVGYAELGALLAERSGGAGSVAVAADSDEHHVTLLLAAAGRPLAIVDDETLTDYADRFADDESADEIEAGPAERQAVGLARALQAGALAASTQAAPRELMALKPVLAAHAAVAAGRHGTAVALREVLRELYPAALRAYPDPAEAIPLAILGALPEPGLLGATAAGRGRDAAVVNELAAAGVADAATISDAITALRVAIAETPRRTGIGKGTTTAVAETISEAVAAVRACDAAIGALIGLLSEKGTAVAAAIPARLPAMQAVPAPPARAAAPPVYPTAPPVRTTPPPARIPVPATRVQPSRVATPVAETPVPEASRPEAPRSAPRRGRTAVPNIVEAPVVTPAARATTRLPVARPPATRPATRPAAAAAAAPETEMPAPRTAAPAPASVPPPPPGITPMFPAASSPLPGRATAKMPPASSAPPMPPMPPVHRAPILPVQQSAPPAWATEPASGYSPADVPEIYRTPAPAGYEPQRYTTPAHSDGYAPITRDDSDFDSPAYPMAPDVAAPGSRDTWPLNPPSYDEEAVRARTTGSYAYREPEPVHVEAPIPRQRDGRVPPPWQTDDIALPPEPPSLRLVEREAAPTPALRLVGSDDLRQPTHAGLGREVGQEIGRDTRGYGSPEPRSAPMLDDADDDLLIFAQASAWFDWPAEDEPTPAPAWSDIDAGWSAAARLEDPEVGEQTDVGLPRRVPQANLVPGSPLPPMLDPGLRIVRDPASMAAHTTGYFRGSRRGEEVRGYAVGGRAGRDAGGGWDFSRDGWDSDRDTGYRSAAHR